MKRIGRANTLGCIQCSKAIGVIVASWFEQKDTPPEVKKEEDRILDTEEVHWQYFCSFQCMQQYAIRNRIEVKVG